MMAWVRLDDTFPDHPKLAQAGPLGMAWFVAAICYCNRQKTDGFVPKQIASRLLDLGGIAMFGGTVEAHWEIVVNELEESGLLHSTESGWQIHDYLDYQPSKAQIHSVSEVRKRAGAKGGAAKREHAAKQNAKQDAKQNGDKAEASDEAKSYPNPTQPNPVKEDANASSVGSSADDEGGVPNGESKRLDLEACRRVWNEVCGKAGLPRCDTLNEPRKKALKARLSEPLFREDPIERWRTYCRKIAAEVGPDPGWSMGRPSFDWAIKPATPARVHEGAYRKSAAQPRSPPDPFTL